MLHYDKGNRLMDKTKKNRVNNHIIPNVYLKTNICRKKLIGVTNRVN